MLADVKDKNIEEKGERMVPAFHKGALVYGEHITRYESVLDFLRGKVVLDIASGSGYGSYIMAEAAKKVYGVDIDEASIDYAKRNYARKNIEYLIGDGQKIPLPDDSVDVVVTFETIEHIKNYRQFLKETKRVLKPDGLVIVSTPNDPEFPEGNHFHLHEFERTELRDVLKGYFKNVHFSYQYTWLFAAVMNEDSAKSEWRKPLAVENLAPVDKTKAIYFMVLCSDKPLPKTPIKELGAISQHWSARQQQLLQQAEAAQHTAELKQAEAARRDAQRQYQAVRQELDKIYQSHGWAVLSKFYDLRSWLSRLLGRKSA